MKGTHCTAYGTRGNLTRIHLSIPRVDRRFITPPSQTSLFGCLGPVVSVLDSWNAFSAVNRVNFGNGDILVALRVKLLLSRRTLFAVGTEQSPLPHVHETLDSYPKPSKRGKS